MKKRILLIKIFFSIQIFMFFIFSCEKKQEEIFTFTTEDIEKFKYLENREIINIDRRVRVEENGCGSPCAVLVENDHLIFTGNFEERQTNKGIDFTVASKVIELKINKDEVIQKTLEVREQNNKEKEEFLKFETYLKNFGKTNLFTGKEGLIIKSYLPQNVKINQIYKDDINKDGNEDFLVLYSFPVDFRETLEIEEQIHLSIILSKDNAYYLQYDGYLNTNINIKIIDIQKISISKSQTHYVIRRLGRGKRWSGEYVLVWFE